MTKFITGKELADAIYDIIWEAEKTLLIVSPFIKLDDYFKNLFDRHLNNHKLHIIIVFGKNENDVKRSLSKDDFDFFKKFPTISIIYVPNLHAKYYGNEKKGMVTSINLYDHSFKNNIEFGMFTEQTLLTQLGSNQDLVAWNNCIDIAENNDVVFIKRPVYQEKKFIVSIGKNFIKSDVLLDYTDHFYSFLRTKYKPRRLHEFPDEFDEASMTRPVRDEDEMPKQKTEQRQSYNKVDYGFCIRTGQSIPFNPNQPMSRDAWRTWNQFGNWDFPERFCHKTGKPSNGKTSMRNPVLYN
ncbi:hypothetical protein HYN59_03700 [Flavobacterium album]|uniref:Phospholipase D-like domain-containing protein n=1 Tax=Flavobacterium album TaxID=2175091 RepID=A0A2S1QV34_9FLAO|nr:hypothetical protein [Flavobacterium album]AWH84272.1 hypothetical protein HYN59_03700 [Flavobacterium album]